MIIKGILVSASLIMAIGSQNAFVLKQGLQKNHIFAVCLTCFVCDFVLMSVGVLGLGSALAKNHLLGGALAICGAVFLAVYGALSFKNAFYSHNALVINSHNQNSSNQNIPNTQNTLKHSLLATLAVTLLNPHVYLDTVVIVGGIAGTMNLTQKLQFLTGALLTSFVWFFGLGFGARLLTPIFQKPQSWRMLEFVIGCVMWWIAYSMLKFAYTALMA